MVEKEHEEEKNLYTPTLTLYSLFLLNIDNSNYYFI